MSSVACSKQQPPETDSKAQTEAIAESIVRLGPFAGTLPCADCSGIRTELTLFAAQPSGAPLVYHLRSTYLGTPDGERAFTSSGQWKTVQGTPTDANARVYQIAFDKPDEMRNFLRVDDNTLRALDRSGAEIESAAPHTLVRDDGVPAAYLVTPGGDAATELRVGQELIVRLPANRSTGYAWALVDTTGAMALKSTQYIQDTPTGLAVGIGGNEYLRLRATRPGTQTLLFEYRRSWEKQAAPASTAEVRVAVTA
jgi:predicted secreted protein/uncharacterized lipoprotein NlpE involved in copper resistance